MLFMHAVFEVVASMGSGNVSCFHHLTLFLSILPAKRPNRIHSPSPVGMSYISLLKTKPRCMFDFELYKKLSSDKIASLRSVIGEFLLYLILVLPSVAFKNVNAQDARGGGGSS